MDAAFRIHSKLGPGLLESVYEVILAKELQRRGLSVERQKAIPIEFDGLQFEEGFRADLIVENAIIVEIKSVEQLAAVHSKQLLTYLRLLDYRLGLLINFGAPVIKDGIKRIANRHSESLRTYLEYTGQVDAEGRKFGTNAETDGRFHSKWLNMMYPRLYLARNLLREDGVMFMSIDDTEVDNLKKICNEIFGEENFVANVVWQKKYAVSNDAFNVVGI